MTAALRIDDWLGRRVDGALPGSRWVTTSLGQVQVTQIGTRGPSVVIAADAPNVIAHYAELLPLLSSSMRVTVLELLGAGRSRASWSGGFNHTFESQCRAVTEVLEQLDGPHVLVFPCVTGLIAHWVALQRKDLVSGVMLLQTATWGEMAPWVDRVDRQRLLRTPYLGQLAVMAQRKKVVRSWYEASVGGRTLTERMIDVALKDARAGGQFSLASMFQQWKPPAGSDAPLTGIPSLVVWGDSDKSHRKTDRRATLKLCPDAAFVELPGAGHSPEIEQPRNFVRLLTDWLDQPKAAVTMARASSTTR